MNQGGRVIGAFVRGGLTVAAGLLLFAGQNHVAQAQSIFCPSAIPSQPGIALSNGTCTNGKTGALSTASLSSETLSELSESTTEAATSTVGNALSARRQTERDRCSDGFERVNGVCRRSAAPERPAAAPTQTTEVKRTPAPNAAPSPRPERRNAAPRVATRPAPFYKAPPPPLEQGVRYAAWAQVIGDYERRTGTSGTSIICCTGGGMAGGIPNPLLQNVQSRGAMVGVLGGADGTLRDVWGQNDAVIVGALSGYLSSDVRLTATSTSSNPTNVGNGQSTLNAHLEGPSAGAYITYFNDRFSGDLTFRADFLNLSESFNETLAFTANVMNNVPSPPATLFPFAGSGSTRLNNYTTSGNVNYRIPVSTISWIEPTTGFQFTQSDYDASAAALGLTNGHLVRVQGGARYGIEYYWGAAKLTTTVTGLAYDDVNITGGFIQNVAFGANGLIINDEGLLRGQGILAFNLAYANGVSLYAQGDVRGGKDLFGAGGKGGIRVTW
jgi:hypothetical protein